MAVPPSPNAVDTLLHAVTVNLHRRLSEARADADAAEEAGDVVGEKEARARLRRLERLYVSVILGWDLPLARVKLP